MVKCTCFETNLDDYRNAFINGTLTCGLFDEKKCLTVKINSGDLHISVNGVIGQEINAKVPENNGNRTDILHVEIANGNLTNFGTLCSQDYLQLNCSNIMLCSDSKYDTAHRGFTSFISLQNELGHLSDNAIQESPKKASSSFNDSRLLPAVRNLNSSGFISILNEEVDASVEINGRNIEAEFNAICGEGKYNAAYDKSKNDKVVIHGAIETCKWKHGVIRSTSIHCIVKQDIYDCSQIQSDFLSFDVGGSVSVVKPWTWTCGEISGIVKGDFLFFDVAVLRRFNQLHVLKNFRIFKTSVVSIKEGGELYTRKEFENNSVFLSDQSLVLDLGQLKQVRDGVIISNEDLLLALRNEVKDSWFGYVYTDHRFFIQANEKVACDAYCVAKEVDVEFFGENAQLVVNQSLIAEEGDLNLDAKVKSESPNFVVSGELRAKGINGSTATVCIMSGAIADITTCAKKGEPNDGTVNITTKWLQICNDSVMTCRCPQDHESEIICNSTMSTNVFCEETLSVHGTLTVSGKDLNIQAKTLNNSGMVNLSSATKYKNVHPSSLSIECEEDVLNSGTIECNGNMSIKSQILSNEQGVIKSSPDLRIVLNSSSAATLCGRIEVDKHFSVHSQSQKEFCFSAVGGKDESNAYFIQPDQCEVRCEKGHLSIDSAIIRSQRNRQEFSENSENNIVPECFFSLNKCLKFQKECELGEVFVEFNRSDENNNAENISKFTIEDSFQANSLSLRSATANNKVSMKNSKENVSFEGSNKMAVIDILNVDESIREIIFDHLFKCSEAWLDLKKMKYRKALERTLFYQN